MLMVAFAFSSLAVVGVSRGGLRGFIPDCPGVGDGGVRVGARGARLWRWLESELSVAETSLTCMNVAYQSAYSDMELGSGV